MRKRKSMPSLKTFLSLFVVAAMMSVPGLFGQASNLRVNNEKPEKGGQSKRIHPHGLKLILQGVGLELSHVLQCRAYLTEFERDYAAFNEIYQSYFPADRRPARTTIGVTALAVGALVEIDMIAKRRA